MVNVFTRLNVFDNVRVAVLAQQKRLLNLVTPASRLSQRENWDILESLGLADKASAISGSLSHGDGKGLELAIALPNWPKLLIMDKPTAGMSPEKIQGAIALIQHLRRGVLQHRGAGSLPGRQRPCLSLKSTHTYYGLSHILFGVSLTVGKGEVVCVLGRNGAGKSSIMGLPPPREWSIVFKG